MTETAQPVFDCWCIVDLYGHQQIAGRVTERTVASQGFIQVDVPETDGQPGYTRLFGPGAIYSITPTSEDITRAFVARCVGSPIQPWQLEPERKALPRAGRDDTDDDYDPFQDREDVPF